MDLFLDSMAFDSRCALERNSPRFQSDEYTFGRYNVTFLRAKGATAHKDEYLS